jgi:hypothetical protein
MTAAASQLRRTYDSVDIAASYFADDINLRLKKKYIFQTRGAIFYGFVTSRYSPRAAAIANRNN